MEPAEASSSTNRVERSFDDAQKRALLAEYDASNYKGRYEILDREQITIRHISRWRSETRGSTTLRVASSTEPIRERVPRKPRVVPALPAENEADSSAEPEPGREPPTRPVTPNPTAVVATPAAPVDVLPQPIVPATVVAPPPPNRPAERPRSTPAADDGVTAHAEALLFHADALVRLLGSPAPGAQTADETSRRSQLLAAARQASTAAKAIVDRRRQPAADEPTRSGNDRGRRPWWGPTDQAAASATESGRRNRWGQPPAGA